MKHLRRIAWNGVAFLSTLLWVALIGQRIAGKQWHYTWHFNRTPFTYRGTTANGPGPRDMTLQTYDLIYLDPDRRIDIEVSYPLAVLLTALLPIAWIAKALIRRRPADGFCAACGYDLRASPNQCPECGAVPPKIPG